MANPDLLFGHSLDSSELDRWREQNNKLLTVASIGCGVISNEPIELASFLKADTHYLGLDFDPNALKRNPDKNYFKARVLEQRLPYEVKVDFQLVDLRLPQSEMGQVDVVLFRHPNPVASFYSTDRLYPNESPSGWTSIAHNAMNLVAPGSLVIVTAYDQKEGLSMKARLGNLEPLIEETGDPEAFKGDNYIYMGLKNE